MNRICVYFSRLMKHAYPVIFALVIICVSACRKEYSGWNVYFNSKMDLEKVPGNEDCPAGGILIRSGLDKNQNDILDSSEWTKRRCCAMKSPDPFPVATRISRSSSNSTCSRQARRPAHQW